MKRAKHPSTVSMKLTSVPELPYKKGPLTSSPKPIEKHSAKLKHDKNEPMVLRSPPTGESIVRFALPIPLSKTKDIISNDEMVRRITTNLKMVLESLYKWFQQQVNQMEEMSKDQSNLEGELQSDGKTASLNIVQIAKLARKFEDIKGRLKERKAVMQAKQQDKELLFASLKHYGVLEEQIEEFIKSHSALISQTETEPGTPSVTNRVNKMMKIFENQTTMLEKALTEQSVIESKYKQMETDFQMLVLEKTLLEGEIRRLREIENLKKAKKEERTKKSGKPEKKKVKDKEKKLSPTREFKSLEELLQIQEAERNKTQLDFVLHQKMETFKEEQSKTKLDRAHSKSKVKGEESKDSLPKKSDTQLSGQKKDQISSDRSKRSVGER
ncbi:coiled-coil domain-containing protein 7-like isoform X2 [Apodemus sylvaticus]|uniref:coiled-coil domain-containing protein 7-like isoform X2 n=1 Tax=Apodemus sylvaticus TaxID=10129 RepID=UPI002243E138|nr:coiled-coil domain-containing protein 7-like isoform X2 [Apodemus sylvaticus]